MKKITTVIGTRPEIIKMSRVIPLLDRDFSHELVFTAQHYDRNMAGVFFEELGVRKPDAWLDSKTSDLPSLTQAIAQHLTASKPDAVLVFGDTNTTLAGAKAARSLRIPIIHLEAGARSFDKRMPEEKNRTKVDRMGKYLFAHSELCAETLKREGVKGKVFVSGNPGVDALLHFKGKASAEKMRESLGIRGDYLLLTLHRSGNVDKPRTLEKFLNALGTLSDAVVFPVHPRTKKRLDDAKYAMPANVKAVEPQGYFEFLGLLSGAKAVVTDSGGVQLECAALGIPCFVARQSTEYWEALDAGVVRLVGLDAKLLAFYLTVLSVHPFDARGKTGLYGSGDASEKIVAELKKAI
jgi:UDP-N-acetylglucosamine 2-epimerase